MTKTKMHRASLLFAGLLYSRRGFHLLLYTAMFMSLSAGANNYVVSSTNNTGGGTLRQAITNANGLAGPHTITFSVSGTINLSTDLPAIVQNITIDGTGQSVTISRNAGGGDQLNYIFIVGTGASGSAIKNLTLKNTGYEVLHVNGSSLSNLTFQNIVCSNDGGDYFNHAIYITQNISNVTIRNFIANNLQNGFAGMHFSGTASNITIDSFVTVNGPGSTGWGLYFTGAVTGINITRCVINMDDESTTDDGDYGIYFNSTVTGLSIDNLTMHDAEVRGIQINGAASNVTISNSTFDNLDGGGGNEMIRFESSMNQLTMTNVTIDEDQSGTADDGDYGIVFTGAVTDATLSNVSVNEADADGVATSNNVTNFTYTGGRLTRNYDGIEFYSCYNRRNVVLQNLRIDSSARFGIVHPNCSGGVNDSLAIYRDTLIGNGYGAIYIYSVNTATLITIKECVISGNGYTPATGNGIDVTAGDNVVISQNSIYDNAAYGIDLSASGNCLLEASKAPVINAVTPLGSDQYQIQFTLPVGECSGNCKVEFFTNATLSGAEAQYYISSVSGLSSGTQTATITVPAGPFSAIGNSLTCTYTRSGAACNGTSEISDATLLNSTVLPLKLLEFSAQWQNDDNVLTTWKTDLEENMSRFEIERSVSGSSWVTIGSVNTANTIGIHNYTFTDNAPVRGVSYYRLKMVELSGAFTYSAISTVNNKARAGTYSVFPNPASEVATVKWSNEQLQPISISIFTISGRQVNASYKMERTRAIVELSGLTKGVYILRLDNKVGSSYQKLIKQ